MKKCSTCTIIKAFSEFNKNKASPDGLQNTCKACKKLYHQGIKKENKRKILFAKGSIICSKCNTEKLIADFFKNISNYNGYSCYCKSCISKINRAYDQKNKKTYHCVVCKINLTRKAKRCKPCRKIHEKAQQKIRGKARSKDPNCRLQSNISRSIRGILKSSGISKNRTKVFDLLGYTREQLKTHIESLFEPWMNWSNWGVFKGWKDDDQSTWKWQLDHIIPQSKFIFKLADDPELRKCWALSNLRPLSAKQNLSEGNRRKY